MSNPGLATSYMSNALTKQSLQILSLPTAKAYSMDTLELKFSMDVPQDVSM